MRGFGRNQIRVQVNRFKVWDLGLGIYRFLNRLNGLNRLN
jgi:hypothetical protein